MHAEKRHNDMQYESEIQEYIAAGNKLRVLLVDDSPAVRRSVRELLELAGISVEEADNGKSALESVYKKLPDLVLLDAVMPGMSGVSVLKAIRNSYNRMQLPIIMLTASDTPTENVMALDLGANDYVSKPLDIDVLWARIGNQLMQKQAAEYMRTAKQRLEQKVRQRTAELDAINARLKQEIEERALIEDRLQKQANFDQLTGLPNRQLAVDRLRQTLIKARRQHLRPCVAFVDLDNFKFVNDTLGHAAGDELLREASRRLLACARKSDTVARLGGDEFLLILEDEGNETTGNRELAIRHVGDRILESFAHPFVLEGKDVRITPSIGFAIYPQDGTDGNVLMRHADVSMYRSKHEGKNLYCFYSPEMTANAKRRISTEAQLACALENNELELYYQPVVDIKSGKICKAEALLRWKNAELGDVSPEYFISIAEESGLIKPIGQWVIGQACRQVKCWREAGWEDMSVSVNIAARQVQTDNSLVDSIKTALLGHALTTDALQIEINESVLIKETDNVVEVMRQLEDMGIGLVLDDFGSGYASLSCLQRYRFDTVKIDSACIKNIADNEQDAGLVKGMIALAGSLGLPVVAEGVETRRQLNLLLRAKCRYAQGFYYSQPLAADAFFKLLHKASHKPMKHSALELVSAKG